jgi:hypothetical protein
MKNLFFCIFILFSVIQNHGQNFVFKAYVDQNNISTDDFIRFTVESSERVQLSNLKFNNFLIRQGPFTSSSSQTTIINGKFKSKNEFKSTFIIAPKNVGKLFIESIKVNYDGKDYQTEIIQINVSKGQKNITSSESTKSSSNNNNSTLFAKISCSKRNPYIGENILLKYKIYLSSYHIRNFDITEYDLPMINDFWTELIEPKNKQWKEEQEIINGISYRVFTLKKEIVSPQKSGRLTIPAFEVSTIVNRSLFNNGISKKIKSNQPILVVKELPPNAPNSFKGQVGRGYKMKVKISKEELKVDEALDFEVSISGNGNLKQIKLPKLNFPKDLEKYPEEIKSKIQLSENGISGRKKLNQLLIPRFHGNYEIPPIEFCYFDVNKNKYQTIKHPGFNVKVNKASSQDINSSYSTNSIISNQQEDVEIISNNIHHIRNKTKLYDYSSPIFGTKLYWVIIGSIPSCLLLLIFILNSKNRFTDRNKANSKKIIKKVIQDFNNLNQNIENLDVKEFYKEIYQLWNTYLVNKFFLELSDLSRDKIKQLLTDTQISSEDVELMDKILNKCEMSQYSPLTNQIAKETLDNSQVLIENLEKNVV